ncbi:hypothetical protein [Thalassococcus sp. S3]|uniref:hypothetical protein n=1 Tax=Thalassococcus sp. S3 TaxID=2017482 RepID=UPI0010248ED9|nr:hypothetical protein [Thalassococcus sp. S3]QBF32653.1 hypothetical protein CFI11_15720 [Thalassococcus sp. S3]
MVELTTAQQRAYMSDYLENGWQNEKMTFASVSLEPGYIDGKIDVEKYSMMGDGKFHFSAQSAMIWISQLGIIYGCWDNHLPKKVGEVYIRNLDITFKRVINKTEKVRFEGFFPKHCKKKLSDNLVYYKDARIHVESGAFTGSASFMVPIA